MPKLTYMSTTLDEYAIWDFGIRDLDVVVVDGVPTLVALSRTGGLTTFQLLGGEPINLAEHQQLDLPPALGGMTLTTLTTSNGIFVMPVGAYSGAPTAYQLDMHSMLGVAKPLEAEPAPDLSLALLVEVDGEHWLFARETGETGYSVYVMSDDLGLTRLGSGATTEELGIQYVTEFAQTVRDQRPVVMMASISEDTIVALRVEEDGSHVVTDSLGASGGFGLDAPSDMEHVTMNGLDYVLVAGAGSSSLSAIRVSGDGQFLPTDHVIDTLDTRFQGATALSVIAVGDRVFVAVGGGDDGISLFVLLPGGRLLLLDTITDTQETAMANVQAVKLVALDGELQLFVTSESEHGISQFSYDISNLGSVIDGSTGDDTLMGTTFDDVLSGGIGNDILSGTGGNDILMDGPGQDQLTGGPGTDVFVLSADGEGDLIMDFQPGVDQLDLSAFPLLNSVDQLHVAPTVNGAVITYLDETIVIFGADGQPLSADDFTTASVLNHPRSPIDASLTDGIFLGGMGDDVIEGSSNGDRIYGEAGNDHLIGNPGQDEIYGEDGDDILNGNAAGDKLYGGNGDDRLVGHAGRDFLYGEDGHDTIVGGGGNDEIHGGAGNDTMLGCGGRDVIYGGDGDDMLKGEGYRDLLYGGSGNDTLIGDVGMDTLEGGEGNDILDGGDANDFLTGGAGDDMMTGGEGGDQFIFDDGFGQDTITDFDPFAANELINFSQLDDITSFSDLIDNHMVQDGADVVITSGADSLTLSNTLIADLSADDFIF